MLARYLKKKLHKTIYMSKNREYTRLITSPRWRALRREKMISEKYMCERCRAEGISRSATEVHHIVPIESAVSYDGMAKLCYDPKNLMCVCASCHKALHEELLSRSRLSVKQNKDRLQQRLSERLGIVAKGGGVL